MSSEFSDWIGRTEEMTDTIEPARSNALRAALGDPATNMAGEAMPLLHHWLYFWNVQPPAGLGEDGHPAKGGFLPPVPLPRRMWAGGRLEFVQPLMLGDEKVRIPVVREVPRKRAAGHPDAEVLAQFEMQMRRIHAAVVAEGADLLPAHDPLPLLHEDGVEMPVK